MNLPKIILFTLIGVSFALNLAFAIAQEVAPQKPKVPATREVVLDGLNHPTGIAIQPNTDQVFIAESGAGRVVRVADGKPEPVITDFPLEKSAAESNYDIGPLSLLFLDAETMLIGEGGLPVGEDKLSIYKTPAPGAEPIKADASEGESRSLPAADELAAAGNYSSLAQSSQGVYVIAHGNEGQTWIALATLNAATLKEFERSISMSETSSGPISAIAISPEGYLAVCQRADSDADSNCVLSFCKPLDGKILKSFNVPIETIDGLAYGPKAGRLFGIHANSQNPAESHLIKIIGTNAGCQIETLLNLERPTSMAFSSTGDLYVTLAGDSSSEEPNGQLIRIKGLDKLPVETETKK